MDLLMKERVFGKLDEVNASPEYKKNVAATKRILEYAVMVPGWQDKLLNSPLKALAEIGLGDYPDPDCLKILLSREEAERANKEIKLEDMPLSVLRYRNFIREKFQSRDEMAAKDCVPKDKRFDAWRTRQRNRCWIDLGMRNASIIHTPLIFEFSLGCSVGCPFCGVAAQGLKTVFRATPENRQMWQDILRTCKEVIGPAAGTGTCYYACEPLDCPDYEVLTADYADILGAVPQTTTAVAMRNPERTKKYLEAMRQREIKVHRFSVLSLDTLHKIMAFFTPEELLDVELLPQFPEAPDNHFTKVGRARAGEVATDETQEDGTIACVSGFVVNMAEKSIRLVTPCPSDESHPTGEIFVDRRSFTDAADFAAVLESMIADNMVIDFPRTEPLRLRETITIEETKDGIEILGRKGFKLRLTGNDDIPAELYKHTAQLILTGNKSPYDIVGELMTSINAPAAHVFFILNKLGRGGIFQEPYGSK